MVVGVAIVLLVVNARLALMAGLAMPLIGSSPTASRER